jgi:hypothetical protein
LTGPGAGDAEAAGEGLAEALARGDALDEAEVLGRGGGLGKTGGLGEVVGAGRATAVNAITACTRLRHIRTNVCARGYAATMSEFTIRLRPVAEDDLAMFRRFATEPGLFGLDWGGFRQEMTGR